MATENPSFVDICRFEIPATKQNPGARPCPFVGERAGLRGTPSAAEFKSPKPLGEVQFGVG